MSFHVGLQTATSLHTAFVPPTHLRACIGKGTSCAATGPACCTAQGLACAPLAAGAGHVCASKSGAPGVALSKGTTGTRAFIKVQLTAPTDNGAGAGKPGPGERSAVRLLGCRTGGSSL